MSYSSPAAARAKTPAPVRPPIDYAALQSVLALEGLGTGSAAAHDAFIAAVLQAVPAAVPEAKRSEREIFELSLRLAKVWLISSRPPCC